MVYNVQFQAPMKTSSSRPLCITFLNWKLVVLPMLWSNFQTNILLVCIIYSYKRLSTLVQTVNYISVLYITFIRWPPLYPCTIQDLNLRTSTFSFNISITVGYHIIKERQTNTRCACSHYGKYLEIKCYHTW